MKRALKWVLVASILLAVWTMAAPFIAGNLIITKDLAEADVIFVLSGSAVFRERTAKAAELYAKGVSKKVVLSNDGGRAGWSQSEETNPRFVDLARRSLISAGVEGEAIVLLEPVVSGTIDEARVFSKRAEKENWRSVLLVTSPYHTKRAVRTFQNEMPGIVIGVGSPAPGDRSPGIYSWWLTPKGWVYVAGEYLKSAYYWLFY